MACRRKWGLSKNRRRPPALAAAMKTQAAKVFLDFARFPWAQVDESEEGYRVSLSDLRFYRGRRILKGLPWKWNWTRT